MTLKVSDRAVSSTALIPNAHAGVIRRAVDSKMKELEELAKDIDLIVSIEGAPKGLDFKGEHVLLTVIARRHGSMEGVIGSIVGFFTERMSTMSIDASELEELTDPGTLVLEMAKRAKESFLEEK